MNDKATIAALKEALQPFADYADRRRFVPAELVISVGSTIAKQQLLMGHCYKALDLLEDLDRHTAKPPSGYAPPPKPVATVDELLRDAADLFMQRNAVYGDNFMRVGPALAALFPGPVELRTAEDHARYYIYIHMMTKMSRYAQNFAKGGHADSVKDITVYAAILQHIDEIIAASKGNKTNA